MVDGSVLARMRQSEVGGERWGERGGYGEGERRCDKEWKVVDSRNEGKWKVGIGLALGDQ